VNSDAIAGIDRFMEDPMKGVRKELNEAINRADLLILAGYSVVI
jgi:hypothetical protein